MRAAAMVTCEQISMRAGELSCLRANRTRHNASKSRAQVARPLQNSRCLFCAGFEDTSRRVLARYLLRTRSIARSGSVSGAYKSPSIAPCKRIASGGVCAALCHPPLLCKASWRVYSYSSSPPALTPPPHSTAQHHQSQNLSLIHISEPTRPEPISYAVFCLKKKKK